MIGNFKLFLLFAICYLLFTTAVDAAQFSESSLRLDRTKISSPVAGTVCAKPSLGSSGTESKVTITFPSDFTISSTASNWSVTTTNLQSDSTAWPGIGTAILVSGKTVTFPSSDLANAAHYCFNFSSTSSQISSAAGQKNATITTKSSNDLVIDTNNFTVNTVNDDQIRVTAAVAANTNSVQANLVCLNTASEVSQDTSIDFEFSYGSYLTDSVDLAIEAEWKKGIIEGSGAPSIDIVDYVYGSATNAINGIVPVVDLVNKKIRWNIINFPANTKDKIVRFAIRTNSSYTGSSKVNFSVVARIIGPGFVTADKVVTKSYKYDSSKVSAGPTATPAPLTTTTTSITTAYPPGHISPTIFRDIFIPVISYDDAKIFISTYGKYFSSIRYGFSPYLLNNKVTSLNKTDKVSLGLTDLKPDSNYYFKAEVRDEIGKVTGTETFTFKTAEVSDKPEVEKSSLIVTTQSNVIFNSIQSKEEDGKEQKANIIVPKQTSYEIRFALKKGQNAKKVQALVRSRNVLGISTVYAEEPNTDVVDMVEVEPGIYAGSLKSKPEPGYYEQFVRIEDDKGNITEEKVADIKVMQPLTILDVLRNPIENARVLISIYNPKLKTYQTIGPNVIPIKNPSYSNSKGEIDLVLPPGKYKALVSNLGYKEQNIEFTIGINPDDGLPTVYLEKEPFNIINTIKYFGGTIRDVFLFNTKVYIEDLSQSVRFFNLIAVVSFGFLVLLTLLSFSLRTHIPLLRLPKYLIFHTKKLFPSTSVLIQHIHGSVVDPHLHSPITQAQVYVIDSDKKIIVDETSTNKAGEFFSDKLSEGHYAIRVMKKGYEPSESKEYPLPDGVPENFAISLHKNETLEQSIRENIYWAFENAVGFSFELLLIASLVLEIIFAYTFDFARVLPFFALSIFNLTLWLFYLRHFFANKF